MKRFLLLFSLTTGVVSLQAAIVFNEILYRPAQPDAAYVELFNTSSNSSVALDGWRVEGLDYTFPAGATIGPQGFLVLARNRTAYTNAFGASTPVFDQFAGNLATNGEVLTLLLPTGATNDPASIVDQVRYESRAPWSTNAHAGSSLQLIDPEQDNSRAANWAAQFVPSIPTGGLIKQDGWRFHRASGNIGPGEGGGQFRLLIYLGEAGSALVDDLSIVAGTNAGVGFNYISNGTFEAPLALVNASGSPTNGWLVGTNYTNTVIVSDLVHSGNGALKVVGESAGLAIVPSFSKSISQLLSPAPPANTTNTLSFWYWATNSATNLYLRVRNSPALGTSTSPSTGPTNINIFFVPNPGSPIPATNYFSPGSNNTTRATIPPFQSLWLNGLQAENVSGFVDRFGEHEPWVEIYNSGSNSVSLNGLYLSANYANLTHWPFPAGNIAPGQFLIVFCDGQSGQTTAGEYHASFRLPAGSGTIVLSRLVGGEPQVIDYLNYAGLPSNHLYRSVPNGQPFFREDFFRAPQIASENTNSPLLNPVTRLGDLTVNASINPNGLSTTTFIQYGVTPSYGITSPSFSLLPATTNVLANTSFQLGPGLTWHYRLVALNAAGSYLGSNHIVTISRLGDLNGDGTVSRSELDSVYAGYALNSPWLLVTNVSGLGETNVSFALTPSVEGAYTVESSTNLNSWQPIGQALPRYLFNDTNAPGQAQRYYRLRWP